MASQDNFDELLQEQINYYRARAIEYDDWFWRRGRYDRGAQANARWHAEVAEVAGALDTFVAEVSARSDSSALELAAGTGLWTQRMAGRFTRLIAVDASPETLAINRERLGAAADQVEYHVANIFDWRPARHYDAVFFSFWLSHVPPERFAAFWALVRDCLTPGGQVFLIDSRYALTSIARDHQLEGAEGTRVTRRLNDGREYRIVKVFYTPERLRADLAALGWKTDIHLTANYFLYGRATLATSDG